MSTSEKGSVFVMVCGARIGPIAERFVADLLRMPRLAHNPRETGERFVADPHHLADIVGLVERTARAEAAEAELARLRPVVEAAKEMQRKRGCFCIGGPMTGHAPTCTALVDALRAAEGGDAHGG